MHGLEQSGGFSARLDSEYRHNIHSPELKILYAASCITFSFGHPLPIGIAAALSGLSIDGAVGSTKTGLRGILHLDSKGLRPRHRVVASLVVERSLDKELRYDIILRLSRLLSVYLNPSTISQRTIPARIARNLMDERILCDWIGEDKACELYANIAEIYGWNARYWEQRALAEARKGKFPSARSFAAHAVSLRQDTLTYNTLGAILTEMAISYPSLDRTDAADLFWEGIDALDTARGAWRWSF